MKIICNFFYHPRSRTRQNMYMEPQGVRESHVKSGWSKQPFQLPSFFQCFRKNFWTRFLFLFPPTQPSLFNHLNNIQPFHFSFTSPPFFLSWRDSPPSGPWPSPSFMRDVFSRPHTTTHDSRQDSSGRVVSSSLRPLPDNTQHSQQTDIHAPGGIRTHDLGRRAASDLHRIPRGRWDGLSCLIREIKFFRYFVNERHVA